MQWKHIGQLLSPTNSLNLAYISGTIFHNSGFVSCAKASKAKMVSARPGPKPDIPKANKTGLNA